MSIGAKPTRSEDRDRAASQDGKRTWLYGEELSGSDIVSFNFYRLAGPGSLLKPCEMSSAKVIEFVLGFEPSAAPI
ncbi:hypothetical protein [Rhizobium laguerreae]|uniref:hypothetical protein n=1 Tax=Rhizobium laguerreae TaxID=1076926 RepID=UPI003CCADC3A